MSYVNLTVRFARGETKSYSGHYSSLSYLLQQRGLIGNIINIKTVLNKDFEEIKGVYPEDSGLVVIDFKTKQIFDMHGGANPFQEIYSDKGLAPPGRKINHTTSCGAVYTNSPKVEALVESGWKIHLYEQGHDFGILVGLTHFKADLEEVGIEPTKPKRWWEFLQKSYLWALIPSKESYIEKHCLNPFPILTREQEKLYDVLKKEAKLDEKSGKIKGEIKFKRCPASETHSLFRRLDAKCYATHSMSSSVKTNETTFWYTILY